MDRYTFTIQPKMQDFGYGIVQIPVAHVVDNEAHRIIAILDMNCLILNRNMAQTICEVMNDEARGEKYDNLNSG